VQELITEITDPDTDLGKVCTSSGIELQLEGGEDEPEYSWRRRTTYFTISIKRPVLSQGNRQLGRG
jgi:hypothetical protein